MISCRWLTCQAWRWQEASFPILSPFFRHQNLIFDLHDQSLELYQSSSSFAKFSFTAAKPKFDFATLRLLGIYPLPGAEQLGAEQLGVELSCPRSSSNQQPALLRQPKSAHAPKVIFAHNLLLSALAWREYFAQLREKLAKNHLNCWRPIFLLAADWTQEEREALQTATLASGVFGANLLRRSDFYRLYLEQFYPYCQDKFLIIFFAQEAELSYYSGQELLLYERVTLPELVSAAVTFWQAVKTKLWQKGQRPNCNYLAVFQHLNQGLQLVDVLARAVKLETIKVTSLC